MEMVILRVQTLEKVVNSVSKGCVSRLDQRERMRKQARPLGRGPVGWACRTLDYKAAIDSLIHMGEEIEEKLALDKLLKDIDLELDEGE